VPILDVEVVGPLARAAKRRLADRLADACGELLDLPKGRTWVRLRFLPLDQYGEHGGVPDGARPVFVRVLRAAPPTGRSLAREMQALGAAVAKACARPPENVHVFYEPPGAGRVAFGGRSAPTPGRPRSSRR
jgi:phenylpyruvate tautomerase PptA (4-oxalocrotonate tautomerase family)